MSARIKSLCFAVLAVALAACSSGGTMTVHDSHAGGGLPQHPSVNLIVNPKDSDSGEVLADVRAGVLGQLLASGRFSHVDVNAPGADLTITVDIVKYSKVTVGERLLVGVFAGKNRVGVNVTIVQVKTGTVLKTFEAEGDSAAHPLSSESGISDAIREVVKRVGDGATVI